MTLASIWQAWRRFWFEPQGTETISVYRILYGLLVSQIFLIHLAGRFEEWYGPDSMIRISTVINHFWHREPRLDLFLLFPQQAQSYTIIYFLAAALSIMLILGFKGRLAAFLVWLTLVSMHHHNPYNINGGDAFLRAVGIFLALSPCSDHFSIDSLIAKRKGILPIEKSPWAQRMIQVSIALVYYQTFWCKISGHQWLDGTAVYYATRLDDMLRFPLPLVSDNMTVLRMLNWFTLLIEFLGWNAIFLKECRYAVVIGLVFLHLGIEYMVNLPVFEWAFIFTLFTFVDAEHTRKASHFIKSCLLAVFFPNKGKDKSSKSDLDLGLGVGGQAS